MNIKLTKKEKLFLTDLLCDNLHIELEKRREQDKPNLIIRELLPKILKKLTTKQKGK